MQNTSLTTHLDQSMLIDLLERYMITSRSLTKWFVLLTILQALMWAAFAFYPSGMSFVILAVASLGLAFTQMRCALLLDHASRTSTLTLRYLETLIISLDERNPLSGILIQRIRHAIRVASTSWMPGLSPKFTPPSSDYTT